MEYDYRSDGYMYFFLSITAGRYAVRKTLFSANKKSGTVESVRAVIEYQRHVRPQKFLQVEGNIDILFILFRFQCRWAFTKRFKNSYSKFPAVKMPVFPPPTDAHDQWDMYCERGSVAWPTNVNYAKTPLDRRKWITQKHHLTDESGLRKKTTWPTNPSIIK